METKTLLTDCPDAMGLISKITNICYKHQLNIIHNNEFVDHSHTRFFMRTELEGVFNDETFLFDLDRALPEGSYRRLVSSARKRIVIMVTKRHTVWATFLSKPSTGPWMLRLQPLSATTIHWQD